MKISNQLKRPITSFRRLMQQFLSMNKASVESKSATVSKKSVNVSKNHHFHTNMEFQVLPTPVKSDSDKKEYRVIQLNNGLTACLISDTSPITESEEEEEAECSESGSSEGSTEDENEESDDDLDDDATVPEQKMAAASLTIGVGSFSDPKHIPGMAHFLEHMVFMGSEKYPEENDFDSFISKHGGSDNASTDCEVTTFYFECLERDLSVALDKFAQFFISPLMKRGSLTREREAIDSEFQMALPSDTYRKEQLLASFAKSDSPVNTFTWGNLITLKDNISEDELYAGVHEFRKRHYSAHRMTLAIQARLPMDILQSYVIENFSKIPSNNLPPDDFKKYNDVFNTPKFTKLYYVQPVNDLIQIDLTWALPSLLDKYKSKPHQYVSWILGHEGRGSLLSYLKQKVWVLGITTGNAESGSEHNSIYAIFSIMMTCTKEGFDHLDEVIEIVFSYINMLKKVGPQERIYNEIKVIADTSFKFSTEATAMEVVEEISDAMQFYPPEDYITGSELYLEYDPSAIQTVLDNLQPQKMNVFILSKNLQSGITYDKTEQWFGTKYAEKDIPQQWLKKWNTATPRKEFSLPTPNAFLTQDFTILEEDENHPDYPEKILTTEIVELWYRKDQKFKLPIAYYYFYLINSLVMESPKSSVLMDTYLTLIQMSLNEEAYSAQVANLEWGIKNSDKGLTLTVSGYNEKLHVLVELILQHFINFEKNLTESMFKAVKDKLTQHYYNRLIKPSNLTTDIRLAVIINNHHSLIDRYNATSYVTFVDVKEFARQFIKNLFIKVLIQGNVTKNHAINVVNNFVATLKCDPIAPLTYPKFRVSQLPEGETYCLTDSLNLNDSNSIVTNYYQSGPFTLKDSVIIEFLMLVIQEPLFDTLRTKEQLGYDVRCTNRDTFGILGFTITVNAQATKNSTEYVESRIEEFMKQATDLLTQMSKETFEETKKDLIKMKQCTDVHLKEEVTRNWTEIYDEDYMFDRIKKEISEIEKLTHEDTVKWWKVHTSGNFRKLSVQVSGFKSTTELGDPQTVSTNLQLNFRDFEDNSIDLENQRKRCIKDVGKFRENLYLYPVICKYAIDTSD